MFSHIYKIFMFFFPYFLDVTMNCLEIFDRLIASIIPGGKHYLEREACCFPKTPNRDDPNDLKRIKLLLDISVTPGPSGVSVNSKVTKVSTASTIWHKIYVFPASCLLDCTCFARKILLRFRYNIYEDGSLRNCDYPDRKMISPRKRIKRSNSLMNRIIPDFFPFSILKRYKTLGTIEFPMADLVDACNEAKNLRLKFLKSVEKRKRTSSGEDDIQFPSNPSSSASSGVKANENPSSEYESSDAHANGNLKPNDLHTSGKSSCVRKLSSDIFDVDENYKSADDPDYSHSEGELDQSSTSVSSNNSSIYEDDPSLEEKTNENGLNASSPATSTTDMHEGDTTNRQESVWLDEGLPRSPCPRNEHDSFYESPGSASGFDSPHSTTSCQDEDGVTSS